MERIPENATFHFNYLGDIVREQDGRWTMCRTIQDTSATAFRLDAAATRYEKALRG